MKKLIVKCMAFLLIVGGLTASFLISKPKNEVNADSPTLYYFDVNWQSSDSYVQVILYVYDAVSLVTDTTHYHFEGYRNSPPYQSVQSSYTNCQFLRYTQLDYDDYDAYISNITYVNNDSYHWQQIVIYTNNLTITGESIGYSLYLPYYPTFKSYFESGEEAGYSNGVNDRNAYWEDYIEETYLSTSGSGYQQIFEAGRQAGFTQGQDSLNTMEWFETTASGVSSILQLKLLPSITIGALIFIPLMFFILKGVLWIWRRN